MVDEMGRSSVAFNKPPATGPGAVGDVLGGEEEVEVMADVEDDGREGEGEGIVGSGAYGAGYRRRAG